MENKYVDIIKKMLEEKMSIREMARKLGMPKTTLHTKIQSAKKDLDDETSKNFSDLLISNKQNMARKGGYAKYKKKLENSIVEERKQNEK